MSVKIKLKHSAVNGKAPLPSDLDNGELALNTNAASPAAYIKDSAGNIVKLAGAGAIGGTDATTTAKGIVQLADATAITAGTVGRVVDAAQLKAVSDADDWTRTGTTLAPKTAGDVVNISAGTAALPGLTPVGDPNTGIYSPGAGQVAVATNGAGRLFVDASGSVLIGGTLPASPNTSLNADGSGVFANKITIDRGVGTENSAYFETALAGTRSSLWTGAGSLYLGMSGAAISTAKISLKADGSATFTGNVTATVTPPSDARFKENITPANPQLADVVALGKQLKNFNWNDEAPLNDELRAVRQLGLIAQEAEKVSPGIVKTIKRTKQGKELTPEKVIPAVYKDVVDPQDEENFLQELVTPEQIIPATYEEVDDSFKGISHDALIMKLLGAVAELSAEVEALKAVK